MKELYTSPEVKLIGFVSSQKLASDIPEQELEWNWGLTLQGDSPATVSTTDIRIELK